MPRVALATYDPGPRPGKDRDLPVLVRELRAAGADAVGVPWDDPGTDWGGFDLVVVRSTWDYSGRAGEFVAWARKVAAVPETRHRNRGRRSPYGAGEIAT